MAVFPPPHTQHDDSSMPVASVTRQAEATSQDVCDVQSCNSSSRHRAQSKQNMTQQRHIRSFNNMFSCFHSAFAVCLQHFCRRYIRYIYNRIILENATVRAAAVSALASFGARVPELTGRVAVLLKRALYDNDDEVRLVTAAVRVWLS
jgi:hypothetical protein